MARSNIDGTVAITRPRPVLRSMPARAVLAGGISRHGGDCLCWLCRPREAEIRARLAKAEADSDIAMVRCCRRALTGDRDALGAYRAAVELEQLMGGAL
ncbi:MAG: hypothetical protein E6J90_50945 [Deltaproteobacteria bacterium]|nr:MAG: hypothetical protein E6J90_50945 [Deltaproteobacteria bacterium]